jgi:hypothetical protein
MLVFIIAIYKRPELTKIVLDYYRKLNKIYPFKIVIAGSEGELSRKLAKGFDYIEVPNFPLTDKNNAMMQRAKIHNPDAVVLLGSDDFICENVIKYYYSLIEAKESNIVGFYDLYFYSTQHEYLSHYDCGGKSYGAGRYFPKSALKRINYTGWAGEYNRGLDSNNIKVCEAQGIKHRVIELSEIDGLLVDVKHNFNISNKNITFIGKQINKQIMARKKIPVDKIDNLPIDKTIIEQPKPIEQLDYNKVYTFIPNGKSKYLGIDAIQITGFEAETFIKKGYGQVK